MTEQEPVTQPPPHPAKFSASIIERLDEILPPSGIILDPMAGLGTLNQLASPTRHIYGVEIEHEWAAQAGSTVWGDSTTMRLTGDGEHFTVDFPKNDDGFNGVSATLPRPTVICTSPAYGSRMADSYAGDAKGTRRFTYRISLGRPLTEGSGAGLHWGDNYRDLHGRILRGAWAVLERGGLLAWNVSDHIRGGKVQPVVAWYLGEITSLHGARDINMHRVATPRMRHGANHGARVDHEWIITARKGDQPR